jgi:hypothetical protein
MLACPVRQLPAHAGGASRAWDHTYCHVQPLHFAALVSRVRWVRSTGTSEKFARFCEQALAHLGDLIPLAGTLNEVNIGPLLKSIGVMSSARTEPWFEAAARAEGSDASRFTPFINFTNGCPK